MRWVVRAEVVRDDGSRETVDLGCVGRTSSTAAKDVGLTLAETKPLLARLQQHVVQKQLCRHSEQTWVCTVCGRQRAVKDYRTRQLATVLGMVPVMGTSAGRANLSGIWTRAALGPGWDLRQIRESGAFTDQNLSYHRLPGAMIPFQPWAEALFMERQRNNGAGAPSERCLIKGVPEAMMILPFKIAQMEGLTIVLFEEANHFRQIHTDGRPTLVDPNPAWWGYSTGRWDGDVFVVETTGFNDQTWLDKAGHPHSDALRTIERFRRVNLGRLDLELTIDDPKAYTQPWTATIQFRLLPDTELLEDACENERDSRRIESIAQPR